MPLEASCQGEVLQSLGASGCESQKNRRDAGGTEVNARANRLWSLRLILIGASHRRAAIFLWRQFTSHMFA